MLGFLKLTAVEPNWLPCGEDRKFRTVPPIFSNRSLDEAPVERTGEPHRSPLRRPTNPSGSPAVYPCIPDGYLSGTPRRPQREISAASQPASPEFMRRSKGGRSRPCSFERE